MEHLKGLILSRRQGHAPAPDHPHEREAARAGGQQAGALLRHRGDGARPASREVGIIIAPETGAEIRDGRRRRLAVRRADHLHRAGRAARPRPRRAHRRAVPRRRRRSSCTWATTCCATASPTSSTSSARGARRADPADPGAGPGELRRGRARRRRPGRAAWSRSRRSRRPTSRSSASTCSRRRSSTPRARSSRPGATSSRSPTRSSTWSTRGLRVDPHIVHGWWKDTGQVQDMLEANRLILDDLEERVEGELIESRVEGRVVIEAGATLERATVRGPAIIGARRRASPTPTSARTRRSART